MTAFQVTITDASVAIDADSPDDPLDLLHERVTFEIGPSRDGQWEATDVEWPSPEPDVEIPLAEFDIDIAVTGPVSGTFDRETSEMTVSLPLSLAIEVSIAVASVDATVTLDATPTTGTSGELTGQAVDLDGSGMATLVDNEFAVPSTGEERIDEIFGLPAGPGRNWFELEMELDEIPG